VGLINVKFIQGEIVESKLAESEGVKEGIFDIITYASVFAMLEDQAGAVNAGPSGLRKEGS
jgi:hypothetical protein